MFSDIPLKNFNYYNGFQFKEYFLENSNHELISLNVCINNIILYYFILFYILFYFQ
jgi:hypothetical protein